MQAWRTLHKKKKRKDESEGEREKTEECCSKKQTEGGEPKTRVNLKDIHSFRHKAKLWEH